jgi:glycerol uptake facilitator-like aquaporin
MFVITAVATDSRVPRGVGGLAIGLAVAQGAIAGGSLTGGSMNPARSWGPALVTGNWSGHWLYWIAPILGAVLGGLTYRAIARGPTSGADCEPGQVETHLIAGGG